MNPVHRLKEYLPLIQTRDARYHMWHSDLEELISGLRERGLGKYRACDEDSITSGKGRGKTREKRQKLLEDVRLSFTQELLLELNFWSRK